MAKGQYQKWITEEGQTLLRGWRRKGLTFKDIAEKIGITESTLYDWQVKYPEISEALKKGKELCDFGAEDDLIAMFKGHYVEEEVSDVWTEGKGENKKVTKAHVHKTKKWVESNVTALIFYLKCRAGWKETGMDADSDSVAKLAEFIAKVDKEAHERTIQS